jgi:hypothetical protein
MEDVRFIWGLPQEDSFMKLKELVTSAPVLALPDDDLPFRLEADGSGIATGAVLLQQRYSALATAVQCSCNSSAVLLQQQCGTLATAVQ